MIDLFKKKEPFDDMRTYVGFDRVREIGDNDLFMFYLDNAISNSKSGNKELLIVPNTAGILSSSLYEKMSDSENMPNIRVIGGYTDDFMNGLRHPNDTKCRQMVTYTMREFADIVAGMERIESYIEPNWSELQKATYLYGVLKDLFPYDKRGERPVNTREAKYNNLQPLSLDESCGTVCLGYSLMYKELCDRQGIGCKMVSGLLKTKYGSVGHCWNILSVDNKSYLVDIQQANSGISYIDRDGNYISDGYTNYDNFAYTGDRLKSYRLAEGTDNYEGLDCIPGMVKHLLANSVKSRVEGAVADISNKWLCSNTAEIFEQEK